MPTTERGCRDRPLSPADPLNLFVVVETGDHHVTILDGDRFEPIAPLPEPLRPAWRPEVLAATAASSSSMSRDGWVTKYDLWNLHDGRPRCAPASTAATSRCPSDGR